MTQPRIEFRCPDCRTILKTNADRAGQRTHCPSCRCAVQVPNCTFYVEPSPPPVSAPAVLPAGGRLTIPRKKTLAERLTEIVPFLPYVGLICGGAVALSLWETPPSLLWLLSYVAVVCVAVSAAYIVQNHWRRWRRAVWVATLFVTPLLIWGYYKTATYAVIWESESNDARYVDTYTRERRIVERLILFHSGSIWIASGGFSDSGKLHGKWSYLMRDGGLAEESVWYWYGEEVSEGEWHLRSQY